MKMFQFILIILGFSLDSFIAIMKKGATIKEISWKESIIYSLIYTFFALLFVWSGYGIAEIGQEYLSQKIEFLLAAMILFIVGNYFLYKLFAEGVFHEKLDQYFSYKNSLKQACLTNFDLLFFGCGLGLMGASFLDTTTLVTITTIISANIALKIGNHFGVKGSKIMGLISVLLLFIFAIYILARFVV